MKGIVHVCIEINGSILNELINIIFVCVWLLLLRLSVCAVTVNCVCFFVVWHFLWLIKIMASRICLDDDNRFHFHSQFVDAWNWALLPTVVVAIRWKVCDIKITIGNAAKSGCLWHDLDELTKRERKQRRTLIADSITTKIFMEIIIDRPIKLMPFSFCLFLLNIFNCFNDMEKLFYWKCWQWLRPFFYFVCYLVCQLWLQGKKIGTNKIILLIDVITIERFSSIKIIKCMAMVANRMMEMQQLSEFVQYSLGAVIIFNVNHNLLCACMLSWQQSIAFSMQL